MLLFLFYKLRQLQVSESVQFSFFIQNVQKRISFVCTICKYEKTSNGHIHNSQIPAQLQHWFSYSKYTSAVSWNEITPMTYPWHSIQHWQPSHFINYRQSPQRHSDDLRLPGSVQGRDPRHHEGSPSSTVTTVVWNGTEGRAFLPYKVVGNFPTSPSVCPTSPYKVSVAPPVFCPFQNG